MGLADRAGEALEVAGSNPARAAALGSALAARAVAAGDLEAASIAQRAVGLAALHTKDVDVAIAHLREAVVHARRSGSARLAAQARMTLAFAHSSRGRSRQGLREIETALDDLDGVDQARAQAQRAVILNQLGRLDDALAGYNATLPVLRAAQDWTWVWRVLSNRAVVQGQRLELTAAEADLREAAQLCERLELRTFAAYTRQNLGWVATLAGDVPAALGYLDDAERRLRALDSQTGVVLRDRAELLLSVYLVAEARVAAEEAIAALEHEHRYNVLPEARLLLARAATLDGDPALAVTQARRAAHEFRRQGRAEWYAAARLAVLMSGDESGRSHAARSGRNGSGRAALREAERVAEALEVARWPGAATDARVHAGMLALAQGSTADARRHWELASGSRNQGPATARARAWYATALLRYANGHSREASVAARAGLRIVDEYRAAMGATDLRARAAGHRTDLVQIGLRLAFDSGRPARVLEWAERGRASLLHAAGVRPPADPRLRAELSQLRAASSEVDELRRAGRPSARAQARQVALERRVRDGFRRRRGRAELTEPVPAAQLAAALGDTVLVELVERDHQLYAVTVTRRGLRLRRLDDGLAIGGLLDRLPFALRRMARAQSGVDSRAAAVAMLRDAAARLDGALLRPLARELSDAPLVVVPTGRLQSVPWSILPSCAGRPVSVAPSATAWYRAAGAGHRAATRVSVIAGPHLPGAEWEAARVATVHETLPLTGTAASTAATLRAMGEADLVHLAAHGRLSASNPLFSSLALADGPLMAYDLEDLDRVPPTVVLAACDSGRHVVCAGDQLLGLAATFLAGGTRALIGSVIPVPDLATAPLMVEFHRLLRGGHSAAHALAQAQLAVASDDAPSLAALAGFVCVGAGH
jgi:hypothetical protein